jgi:hypothetical protein
MIKCPSCGEMNVPDAVSCIYCHAQFVQNPGTPPPPPVFSTQFGDYETEYKGVFASLFDFNFVSFITTRVYKFLYGFNVILSIIGFVILIGAVFLTPAFGVSNAVVKWLISVGIFLVFIFYLIFLRVGYELTFYFIHQCEDVRALKLLKKRNMQS